MLSLLLFSTSRAGHFVPMLLVTHNSTLRWCYRFRPGTHDKLQHGLVCKVGLGFRKFDAKQELPWQVFSYLYIAILYLLASAV